MTRLALACLCAVLALVMPPFSSALVLPQPAARNPMVATASKRLTPVRMLMDKMPEPVRKLLGNDEPSAPAGLPPVVVEPDYKLGAAFLVAGVGLDTIPYIQWTLGPVVTLLGVLFLVQTTRIRFIFDDDAFELKTMTGNQDELADSGENFVVGGANRWAYESFVNYDFFPSGWIDQPQGPILVYFKETQTPSEEWDVGPGAQANSAQALAAGAVPGQVHFFPAICNTKQLREEFARRGCAKL